MDFSKMIDELDSLEQDKAATNTTDEDVGVVANEPISEAINGDQEFNDLVADIENSRPQPLHQLEKRKLDEGYTVPEPDKDMGALATAGWSFTGSIMKAVQGVETLVSDAVAFQVGQLKADADMLGNILKGDFDKVHLPKLDDKEYEERKAIYHDSLKVSKYINDAVGKPIVPSVESIIEYSDKVENQAMHSDSITMKGAVVAGEIAGFIASWEATLGRSNYMRELQTAKGLQVDNNILHGLSKGKDMARATADATTKRMSQYTIGDVAKMNAGFAGQTAIISIGEGKDAKEVSTDALIAFTFGSALQGALGLGAKATANWHPFSKDGTKLTKGFMDDAMSTTYRGKPKKLYEDMDAFGKRSTYGSWDALPEMTKILWLASKSESGQVKITNAMKTSSDTFDAVMNNLRNLDSASQELLAGVKDVSKVVESGKQLLPHEVSPAQPTYLQQILTNAGFIKGVGGSGKDDVFGREWEVVSATLKNDNKEANRLVNSLHRAGEDAIIALKTGLKDISDGFPPKPEALNFEALGNAFKLRLMSKREGKPYNEVVEGKAVDANGDPISGLRIDDTDLRDRALSEEWGMVSDAIKANATHIELSETGEIDSVYMTPYDLYKAYQQLKANTSQFSENKLYDATKAKQLEETMLDILDDMAEGSNYKDVLKNAVTAQAYKRDIIEKFGLAKLMSSKSAVTPSDIRQYLINLAHTSTDYPKGYRHMIESLGSAKEQVEVETALIKALAISRETDLKNFAVGSNEVEGRSSVNYLRGLDKANAAIENFVPVTREGRILQEGLKSINEVTNGLIRTTLGTQFDRSIISEVRVGVGQYFHRIAGSIQTNKGAINNVPYVANKLKKLEDILSAERTKSPISGESVLKHYTEALKRGDLTLGSDIPLKTSVEISRMVANLRRLKGVAGGDVTKPYTPKPTPTPSNPSPSTGTGGASPSPTTLPPQVVRSIAEHGELLDTVFMTNADLTKLKGKQQELINNIINDKGVLPSARETDEWVAFNKKLKELSKADGHTILIDPTGHPQLVIGENGIRLNPSSTNPIRQIHNTGNTIANREYSIYDILDKKSVEGLLEAFGENDALSEVRVRIAKNTSNTVGSVAGLAGSKDLLITLNMKHERLSSGTNAENMKAVLSTLVHEIRHYMQYRLDGVQPISVQKFWSKSGLGVPKDVENNILNRINVSGIPEDVKDNLKEIVKYSKHTKQNISNEVIRQRRYTVPSTVLYSDNPVMQRALADAGKTELDLERMKFDEREEIFTNYVNKLYKNKGVQDVVQDIGFATHSLRKGAIANHFRYEASKREMQARFTQAIMEGRALSGDTDVLHQSLSEFVDINKDKFSAMWGISPESQLPELIEGLKAQNSLRLE